MIEGGDTLCACLTSLRVVGSHIRAFLSERMQSWSEGSQGIPSRVLCVCVWLCVVYAHMYAISLVYACHALAHAVGFCMCVHVHVQVYVCVLAHVCIYIYIYIHTCLCLYLCVESL